MAKIIIECNTNGEAIELGEAFEILENVLYAIGEAKLEAFKDFLDAAERKDFEKADFYDSRFKKFKKLGRQIKDYVRVEP